MVCVVLSFLGSNSGVLHPAPRDLESPALCLCTWNRAGCWDSLGKGSVVERRSPSPGAAGFGGCVPASSCREHLVCSRTVGCLLVFRMAFSAPEFRRFSMSLWQLYSPYVKQAYILFEKKVQGQSYCGLQWGYRTQACLTEKPMLLHHTTQHNIGFAGVAQKLLEPGE